MRLLKRRHGEASLSGVQSGRSRRCDGCLLCVQRRLDCLQHEADMAQQSEIPINWCPLSTSTKLRSAR